MSPATSEFERPNGVGVAARQSTNAQREFVRVPFGRPTQNALYIVTFRSGATGQMRNCTLNGTRRYWSGPPFVVGSAGFGCPLSSAF